MEDYQGNANKPKAKTSKAKGEGVIPAKKVQKVVVGEVVVQKKSLGTKIKGLFVAADFRTVIRYVASDVLLPAARNMIVDASSKGVERMMYGDRAIRQRNFGGGSRFTYNNPINRGEYRDPRTSPPALGQSRVPRQNRNDFLLASREEAKMVLERMNDILESYELVTVGDLNELVGFPSSHVDEKWGWTFLGDVEIRQVREGYLIMLPPAESI